MVQFAVNFLAYVNKRSLLAAITGVDRSGSTFNNGIKELS